MFAHGQNYLNGTGSPERVMDIEAASSPSASNDRELRSANTFLPETSAVGSDDENGKHKYQTTFKESIKRFFRMYWIESIYFLVTTILLIVLVYFSYFAAIMTNGTNMTPEILGCRDWAYGGDCGMWGINCRPFESDWMAIRCRSRCAMDESSSLAVYGSSPYRGDSRICRAAIHAGVISSNGGCALMRFRGAANSFEGTTANGVTSRGYNSWFPKTFEFQAAPSQYCTDLTWLILSVGYLVMAGYVFLPHTNPAVLYGFLMTWGFFYVRLIGQPQSVDYAGISVTSFADIFIVLAISSWLYKIAPSYTFAQWEKLTRKQRMIQWSVCYVIPFHILINMNMFEYIPWLNIDFGGYDNASENAGTYIVFGGLGIFVLYALYSFGRKLYRQRLWPSIVVWYSVVVLFVVLSWALFPSSDFHLHHTMLGALLLPLTRFSTPFAFVTQSALLGCFIQGYAAWGWAPYLTTIPTYLTIPVAKVPPQIANITTNGANLSWTPLELVNGYSLRINHVEVYRGVDTITWISGLQSNMTYFVTVAGIADRGEDGQDGVKANFTTLASNTSPLSSPVKAVQRARILENTA